MTLIEFLAPLKSSRSNRNKVLAVLYYHKRYSGVPAMTSTSIRAALVQARVPKAGKINVADVLAKSGEFVDSSPASEHDMRRLWQLTDTGDQHVRELLGLPLAEVEIEHDVGALMALAAKVSDETVRGYVEEAIKCLRAGALRAAVVFFWSGAIRMLHEAALEKDRKTMNDALKRQYPKARNVSSIEHFGWIDDRVFLEATPDIGLLDKGQKDTLLEQLNLRNRCGHPTRYTPREAKAKSFIEDVLGIVFA